MSSGSAVARERAALALGIVGGKQAEQALRRARTRESEKNVVGSIDEALTQIENARAALREITDPAAVARHCLARDPGFVTRSISAVESLCHVENGRVSEHGDWWLVTSTASGGEGRRIGTSTFDGYSIATFIPSPDGKYLAVLSSAEGAPFLQVADLPALVRHGDTRIVRELPLPLAQFSLKEWKGSALLVASGSDVTSLPGTRRLSSSAGKQIFSWDVAQ